MRVTELLWWLHTCGSCVCAGLRPPPHQYAVDYSPRIKSYAESIRLWRICLQVTRASPAALSPRAAAWRHQDGMELAVWRWRRVVVCRLMASGA